jgi:hypothetical protein
MVFFFKKKKLLTGKARILILLGFVISGFGFVALIVVLKHLLIIIK